MLPVEEWTRLTAPLPSKSHLRIPRILFSLVCTSFHRVPNQQLVVIGERHSPHLSTRRRPGGGAIQSNMFGVGKIISALMMFSRTLHDQTAVFAEVQDFSRAVYLFPIAGYTAL